MSTAQFLDQGNTRCRVEENTLFVSTVPPGSLSSIMLDLDDDEAADANTERWTSTTGCKAFRVIPKGVASGLGSLEGIIFAWSTTAADLAALNTLMGTMDTGMTTPGSGGIECPNVGVLFPVKQAGGETGWVGNTDWVVYDGQTLIKTIAVRSSGADYVEGALLQLIS